MRVVNSFFHLRKAAQELIYTLVNTCETHVWQSDRENIWNIQHSLCCMCSHSSCLEININKMPLWNVPLFRARSVKFIFSKSVLHVWMNEGKWVFCAGIVCDDSDCGVLWCNSQPSPYMATNTNYFLGLSTITSHIATLPTPPYYHNTINLIIRLINVNCSVSSYWNYSKYIALVFKI